MMGKCLLYQIRPNVRTIYMEYEQEPRGIKLFVYLDTDPEEEDFDLMENVKLLFISYDGLLLIGFDTIIERSNEPFEKIYTKEKLANKKMHMLYARYEP